MTRQLTAGTLILWIAIGTAVTIFGAVISNQQNREQQEQKQWSLSSIHEAGSAINNSVFGTSNRLLLRRLRKTEKEEKGIEVDEIIATEKQYSGGSPGDEEVEDSTGESTEENEEDFEEEGVEEISGDESESEEGTEEDEVESESQETIEEGAVVDAEEAVIEEEIEEQEIESEEENEEESEEKEGAELDEELNQNLVEEVNKIESDVEEEGEEEEEEEEDGEEEEGEDEVEEDEIEEEDDTWIVPMEGAEKRCDFVTQAFQDRDDPQPFTDAVLKKRYKKQKEDSDAYFRGSNHIFWLDYVHGDWGMELIQDFLAVAKLPNISSSSSSQQQQQPLEYSSIWTWITGDQHLGNFGAWMSRSNQVVFGVNDFDEGIVYDFQVDLLRCAICFYIHGKEFNISDDTIQKAISKLVRLYVSTILGYIGNDDAMEFEVTSTNTHGEIHYFLKDVIKDESVKVQMDKFTKVDKTTGVRAFKKGSKYDKPDSKSKLAPIPTELYEEISSSFTEAKYGATRMKLGRDIPEWDDDFFTILDIGKRIGSGVGSFGVDRYYVLLKGTDGEKNGAAIILDIKFQPTPAFARAVSPELNEWYHNQFPNEAARTSEAQRHLNAFADPFTGWIFIHNGEEDGKARPFSVRQRSPWKGKIDLEDFTDDEDFMDLVQPVAQSLATSHVRGNVGYAEGEFKHVIQALFENHAGRVNELGSRYYALAAVYQEQIALDYDCFLEYYQAKFH